MSQETFPDPLGRSRAEISMEVTIAILIYLISLLGNALVVYVIHTRCKTPPMFFIHNLALTDIFMPTFNMPLRAEKLYTGTCNLSQE